LINTITDIIGIVTVAQLILFALFLLGAKKDRGSDKKILAFFLLANSFYIFNFLALRYRTEIIPYTVNIFFIGHTFGFLFGPLLYLYTHAVTSRDFHFSIKDTLHLLPFVFVFCMTLVLYQFQPYEVKLKLLKTGLYDITSFTIYFICLQAITLSYLSKAFQLARRKNKKLKLYFSSLEKINFEWLKLVVTAFLVMWIVDIIALVMYFLGISTITSTELLYFISLFINFIFANLLILKNLKLPSTEDTSEKEIGRHKYENSRLTEQEKSDILFRLENLMKGEKLYLNSSLNLGETAEHLNIAPRYLSQVINELKEQNFYDYVNSYRIDEAKKFLGDSKHENDKILAILGECGFNSKSAFNTMFKKVTGITPSEYRKRKNKREY
jgi:AraC-like DNA-binding protein